MNIVKIIHLLVITVAPWCESDGRLAYETGGGED